MLQCYCNLFFLVLSYVISLLLLSNISNFIEFSDELEEYGRLGVTTVDGIGQVSKLSCDGKKFNILHLNIRSLQKNFDELLIYLNEFDLTKIDILVLSETFIIENFSRFAIAGFDIFYNQSKFNKNDGVIIYTKQILHASFKIIELTEINLLRCNISIDDSSLGIIGVYRPPSTNLNLFLQELESKVFPDRKMYDYEIFVGDLNINILDETDITVVNYLNILTQNGYVSCINQPTRESDQASTAIDHIFLRFKEHEQKKDDFMPFVVRSTLTDHYLIGLSIKNINKNIINLNRDTYTTRINYINLNKQLSEETWIEVLSNNDVEGAYSCFKKKIISLINKNTNMIKINSKNRKRKPWITQGIINSINQRDLMKKKLIKEYSAENDIKYKTHRNILNKTIKFAKINYYKVKLNESKNDYKKIWNIMNEVTNSQKKNSTNQFKITNNGNIITDEGRIGNIFNDFFSNIGRNIQNDIKKDNNYIEKIKLNPHSLFLSPVRNNELVLHIGSLKNNSAPGEDKITTNLIKNIHNHILEPLKHIINLSFTYFTIPLDWKKSIVTPIYKTGSHDNVANYRPISVINNFAKLFEKCLKTRIMDFLESNNILYKKQYGFRNKKSTEDAVFDLINNININLKNKKKSLAVFMDLSRAFDTVSHSILFDRLERVGIRDGPLILLKNYLFNRTQSIKINTEISDPKPIETGVPQGTVLGPVLFLVYINDIGGILENCDIVSYADDTALLFTGNAWSEVYDRAELGLSAVHGWLKNSLLSLNYTKTYFMTFSATQANQPNINEIGIHDNMCMDRGGCNCVKISKITKIKYLGVILDQHLKWEEHIAFLNKKIRNIFYKFFQLREILNEKLLLILYNALIESNLRYCIIIWGCAYNNTLKKLSVTQNAVLKIMFRKPYRFSTEKLYTDYNVLSVRNLYAHSTLNYIIKISHPINNILNVYTTRSTLQQNIDIPFMPDNVTQRFITYYGPVMFNSLPADIKSYSNNPKKFKFQTKQFLLKNQNNYNTLF